jgi:hypothetical protein
MTPMTPSKPPAQGAEWIETPESSVPKANVVQPAGALSLEDQAARVRQTWVLVGTLIAISIIAGIVIMRIRRSILAKATHDREDLRMMESLRRMRDSGEMTEAEFQAARKRMISKMAPLPQSPSGAGQGSARGMAGVKGRVPPGE